MALTLAVRSGHHTAKHHIGYSHTPVTFHKRDYTRRMLYRTLTLGKGNRDRAIAPAHSWGMCKCTCPCLLPCIYSLPACLQHNSISNRYHSTMILTLLLALTAVQRTTACQRELRSLDLGQQSQQLPLVPRQTAPFPPVWNENEKILHTSFSTSLIDTWSSYYTHGDHIAGRNKSMAEETAKTWTENGVPASLVEYEVFLNYPKEQSLVLKTGNLTQHTAQLYEDALPEDETTSYPQSQALPAFHGYSASGQVEAEYVYVG